MVDENLAREAISLLGTATAMLIEDAHDALVVRTADAEAVAELAAMLERMGAKLQAPGAAAAVMAAMDLRRLFVTGPYLDSLVDQPACQPLLDGLRSQPVDGPEMNCAIGNSR